MMQGLGDRQIGVVQLDILADQGDLDPALPGVHAREHAGPFAKVWRGRVDAEFPADDIGQMAALQHERCAIQLGHRAVFNDAVGCDIAEQRNFSLDILIQWTVNAADDEIGLNAHAAQFLDRVLGRLGFWLVRARDEWHERHMQEQAVAPPDLGGHLTDSLQERLGFDVAGRAADLGDDNVGVGLFADRIDERFDLARDMRDDLHGLAEVLARALLVEHVPVDLAGRQVGKLVEILVDKALIMAEIQVGLGAVLGDKNLAVLKRAHRAWVHIDIGIELLGCDLQAAAFEQAAERGRRDALAEAGNHAAGHKDIFGHTIQDSFPPQKSYGCLEKNLLIRCPPAGCRRPPPAWSCARPWRAARYRHGPRARSCRSTR